MGRWLYRTPRKKRKKLRQQPRHDGPLLKRTEERLVIRGGVVSHDKVRPAGPRGWDAAYRTHNRVKANHYAVLYSILLS